MVIVMVQMSRKDRVTERDVKTIIRVADLGFPKNAAELARKLGVPLEVSLRVILHPKLRRST